MEQHLDSIRSEGKTAFRKGNDKNPYKENTNEHGAWVDGWKSAKSTAKKQDDTSTIEQVALSENKQKAIKDFSEMIAKDCAGLIEKLIEKRVRMYATHLAEIMQENG